MGMTALRIHDLRHGFASTGVRLGLDLLVVGGLLGHRDKGTTAGYAHLDESAVAEAAARVDAHLGRVRAKGTRKTARLSVFEEFARSKERLPDFCAARGLDPDAFHRDLAVWRRASRRARA